MTLEEYNLSKERIDDMLAVEDELRAFEKATWLDRETLQTLIHPLSKNQRVLLLNILTKNDADDFIAQQYSRFCVANILTSGDIQHDFYRFFMEPVNIAYETVGKEVANRLDDGRITFFGPRGIDYRAAQ